MVSGFKTGLGDVNVAEDVVAIIAGIAATECYGLVGMAPRNVSEGIFEILNRENFGRGVDVKIEESQVVVGLHIVVEYGTRISEVAHNVMEKVKYAIEHFLGLQVSQVNINIKSVRVSNSRKTK